MSWIQVCSWQPQTPWRLAAGSRSHISSSQDPSLDLHSSIPMISQYIPIQVHQIPHIILLSFLSTGAYRKVCSTSCFKSDGIGIDCPPDLRGLEHCSTINYHPSYLIQSSTSTQSYSLSVLPKHQSDLTHRSDPTLPPALPTSELYLTQQQLYQNPFASIPPHR